MNNYIHRVLMLIPEYRFTHRKNIMLEDSLDEKTRKLAGCDEQIHELTKANEHHMKLARERKIKINELESNRLEISKDISELQDKLNKSC